MSAKLLVDREILLPLGIYLGVTGNEERAIAVYESLRPYLTENATIDINISEIYSKLGEKAKALEYAAAAYAKFPESPLVRTIYGMRCAENNDFSQAILLIPDSVPAGPYRKLLLHCLEKNLEENFQEKRWEMCQNLIARIQAWEPDNAVAKAFLEKIREAKEKSALQK